MNGMYTSYLPPNVPAFIYEHIIMQITEWQNV